MQGFKDSQLLILDDQKMIEQHLSDKMKDLFTIIKTENGYEGIDIISKNNIQLILINLMLSKMDSLEFCQRLRKMDLRTKPIALILSNSFYSNSLKHACLKSGGNDIIFSPLSSWQIETKIQDLAQNYRKQLKNS